MPEVNRIGKAWHLMLAPLLLVLVSASPVTLPFERYTLPNGLTVILHEDHSQPRVVVNVAYNVGSADEKPGRTGFAHLFEHLMFMGTPAVPNSSFDTLMEQVGGYNNAWTSWNTTDYFEAGPSNLLETFLFLEGDRLVHLPEAMTKAKVDLQRDVVKNERRQSYENRPYGMSEEIMVTNTYPVGHPYHHTVIGSHADLTAASVDDVKAFFRKYYVPANASLTIAGDFDPAEAKKFVETFLGGVPRVEAPLPPVLPVAEMAKSVRVTQPDSVQHERVEMIWLAPAGFTRGAAECELLAGVLADGKSSRLIQSVVTEQGLAEDVDASFDERQGQATRRAASPIG
jgi:predicted Zn-dependent peptidase